MFLKTRRERSFLLVCKKADKGKPHCTLRMWATVDKHPYVFVLGQSVSNHHGDCSYHRQHRTLRKTTPQWAGKEQYTTHPRQEPSPHTERGKKINQMKRKIRRKGIDKYCDGTLGWSRTCKNFTVWKECVQDFFWKQLWTYDLEMIPNDPNANYLIGLKRYKKHNKQII